MRVKITKTIHVNDIAGESRRMLDGIKNRIMYTMPDKVSTIVRASLSNQGEEFFQTIALLTEFRKELAELDENLQDVQNIIQGYKDAIMPPPPEPDKEWLEKEQAEYEKFMAQVADAEEGFDEEG